jgi:prepilin-type N-terminal cleavage/methylation domain-containing protein
MRVHQYRKISSAFSLIELLVVIFIMGLLLALALVAASSSREAARKAQCADHLKQIGIALASHHASHNRFPTGIRPDRTIGGNLAATGPLSTHYQLLPYLDQGPVFNGVNVVVAGPSSLATDPRNRTAAMTVIASFLCPSDSHGHGPCNNYRANVGPNPHEFDSSVAHGGGGAFPGFQYLADRDFRDGLSNTAGFSERSTGSRLHAGFQPRLDYWFSGLSHIEPNPDNNRVLAACAMLTASQPEVWTNAGERWITAGYANTLYNHVAPPNWSRMDCSVDLPFGEPGDVSGGAISARSHHPGGMHTLMMDGRVTFVKDTVSIEAWRSLGSRSGGEALHSHLD